MIDPFRGQPRGVPIDLAKALARKICVSVQFVTYTNYVELLQAADRDVWDVTFLTVDRDREEVLDLGPASFPYEFTYLVPPGSPIQNQTEVDRTGVRVAVADGPVTASNQAKTLKAATLVRFKTLGEIRSQAAAGSVDAIAAGCETLVGLARQLPGSRILDGAFLVDGVAMAAPKNHRASLAFVSNFTESAKMSGSVRQAFEAAGFRDAADAPPAPARQ
ncbi:MAG TPA: transporter substrate-binding domain-containing protein [Caldimonas sp.]|jgi:polar amino acid transport system substrate-binding protein|nr:transporter substrate-binding domain-containing protein [Caldimonas sp.]HEX4234538.1 transporter substrate-binding domain-containing protein [Caldimonas sp.]